MTRKRYINLLRAIIVEMAKYSYVKPDLKNLEHDFKTLHNTYAKGIGKYSYAELWKIFIPIAHRYGIGGY